MVFPDTQDMREQANTGNQYATSEPCRKKVDIRIEKGPNPGKDPIKESFMEQAELVIQECRWNIEQF